MGGDSGALVDRALTDTIALHEHMRQHAQPVVDAAAAISVSLRAGGKLLLFGNVVAAFEAAHALGLQAIALTGSDGGAAGRAAAIHVNVPAVNRARVQEVHRTLLLVICDLVERSAVDA